MLNYERHLFQERELRSVTANTRDDGREFLALAASIPIEVTTQPYRLEHADRALADLAADCGYFDQAHLAREFRALAGCPPSQWLAEEFRNVQAGNWVHDESWGHES